MTIHTSLARVCRDRRTRLGITQAQLGQRAGLDRAYIAKIERGRANPTFDAAERIVRALGLEVDLLVEQPMIIGERTSSDRVHGWCSGYVDRRLVSRGWLTAREERIDAADGRAVGWIDLLAFDPLTATLLIIEIKSRLDDIRAVERQLGWYERHALLVAKRNGWSPRRVVSCLLLLHSEQVERSLLGWRDVVARAFPTGADDLATLLGSDRAASSVPQTTRALALIDPARRGARWLIGPRVFGGRSLAPYRDFGDAAARVADGRRSGRSGRRSPCPSGTRKGWTR